VSPVKLNRIILMAQKKSTFFNYSCT